MKLFDILKEGNLRLSPHIKQEAQKILQDIEKLCLPHHLKHGTMILKDYKNLPTYTIHVSQKRAIYDVIRDIPSEIHVHVQARTLQQLLNGNVVFGEYRDALGAIIITMPYITPMEMMILGSDPSRLDDETNYMIKQTKEILNIHFSQDAVLDTIEHELTHAIDPTMTISKAYKGRTRKRYTQKPYEDNYFGYHGHGSGKTPVEFNPHMQALLTALERAISRYGLKSATDTAKSIMKNRGPLPRYLKHLEDFITASLNDQITRKRFITKLYQWLSEQERNHETTHNN